MHQKKLEMLHCYNQQKATKQNTPINQPPPPNIGSPQSTQERRATRRPATPKPRKAGLVTVRNSAAVLGPLDVVVQTVKSPSVTRV